MLVVAVEIQAVVPGSPAAKKRIRAGDTLVSINAHPITDVLDYQFYLQEETLRLHLQTKAGRQRRVTLRLQDGADIGLVFATFLMDKHRHCQNKCVFCFIDQLPKGLRESLYFKDDDARLSFLFGNYITLTNLTQREVARIITMRISPVRVSVHTMDPGLRVKMMGNPNAGESLRYLRQFADAGLAIHAQLVICPGMNDGEALSDSLQKLAQLYPSIQSIAVVPVGLTCHREGLPQLRPFTKEDARDALRRIEDFNSHFLWYTKQQQSPLAVAADELYLKAELAMPEEEHYADFPQLENGVGMSALFVSQARRALKSLAPNTALQREISLATGGAAYGMISALCQEIRERFPAIRIQVHKISNHTFGESVTVAGLLCGKDFQTQLQGKSLGEQLLLPASALRREDNLFLDDMSLAALQDALQIPILPVENDGAAFVAAVTGLQIEGE